MGGAESKQPCSQPLNPDILSVITLSDSAVQRLPLDVDDSPLEKELRKQNTDDFWRERLTCLDNTFLEAKRMNEKEFQRLEFAMRKLQTGSGTYVCPRILEDSLSCYQAHEKHPLNCSHVVQNLQLCLDTKLQESSQKRYNDYLKKSKRRNKC